MNVALAREVQRRILAEPQLVGMDDWMPLDFWEESIAFGRCGTACCIAGHTLITVGDVVSSKKYTSHEILQTSNLAAIHLGLNEEEAHELFLFHQPWNCRHEWYIDLAAKLTRTKEGTPEYAAVVVEAIERCIERNSPPPAKVVEEEELVLSNIR